jgi:undecaprenyl-diphosphatase
MTVGLELPSPDLWRALVLGALQGATEFLPVSSSGHLIIVPELLGWPASTLTFDVVVHLATALAVLIYFREDWRRLGAGLRQGLRLGAPWRDPDGRQLTLVLLACIPAVVAGVALEGAFERLIATNARGAAQSAALMLVVTGGLLLVAERVAQRLRPTEEVGTPHAMAIGLAQAMALTPGLSRSGATIAAGLATGIRREEAARFSFLMATPIIVAAAAHQLVQSSLAGAAPGGGPTLVAGFGASFLVGYLSIGWLLGFVRRAPLYVFVAYTWLFGLAAWWILRG